MRFRHAVVLVAVLALFSSAPWMAAATVQASSLPSGQIAFVRDGDIWVMDANGGNAIRLTSSPLTERDPTWSPDGRTIAFVRAHATDGYDVCRDKLCLIDPGGGDVRAASFELGPSIMPGTRHAETSYGIDDIAWEPDGTDICVAANSYAWEEGIGVMNNNQLYLVHPDGTSQRRIGPLIQGIYGGINELSWRPDGSQLLMSEVFRQGGGRAVVYDLHSEEVTVPFPSERGGRTMWNAAWSPDGGHIAASVKDDPAVWNGPDHVVVIDMQSRAERSLELPNQAENHAIQLVWSPDGAWLACASFEGWAEQPTLYLVSVDGRQSRLLAAKAASPAWRPSGSSATQKPLVVLIGGLGSDIPASGGDWTFVKQRLEKAGFEGRVFVAKTHPGLPAGDTSDVIDSESPDWRDSAARLDHQLSAAGYRNRDLVLVGHSMGGLIARAYAANWEIPGSGCRPLGIVQLGTPNKGSKAANLAIGPLNSAAADRLADDASMAAFNNEFPNAEALPIYRIAGSYFPKSAYAASLTRPDLGAIWNAISAVYGTAYNDSVVTVDSVRGGPTAGWKGCDVFKAVHANSKWLSSFRDKAGCVLPRRSGKKGAAAIDELIMQKIIEDVRGVEKSSNAATRPTKRTGDAKRGRQRG